MVLLTPELHQHRQEVQQGVSQMQLLLLSALGVVLQQTVTVIVVKSEVQNLAITPSHKTSKDTSQKAITSVAAWTKNCVSCFTARDNSVERSHTVQKVPQSKDVEGDC